MINIEYDFELYKGLNKKTAGNFDFCLIWSKCENCCDNLIIDLLTRTSDVNSIIFYATGLPDDLKDIIKIRGVNIISYEENDEERFIIKVFPKLILKINNNDVINAILKIWTCSIPEVRRFICLKDEKIIDEAIEIINNDNISELLKLSKLIISNVPDFKDDSFYIIYRNDMRKLIEKSLHEFNISHPTEKSIVKEMSETMFT